MQEPTTDERRVLAVLVTGLTDDAAAARLGWTRKVVRTRLAGAMAKLGAASRLQAGYAVARAGWLAEPGARAILPADPAEGAAPSGSKTGTRPARDAGGRGGW